MSLIYITGPTGSGKSSVREALRVKGFETHDTDDEGMRKMQNVGDKVLLSLDMEALRKIYEESEDKLVFICGTSPNDLDKRDLFSKVILLKIDATTQKERITSRTNNQYGKEPHQLAAALKWREVQIEKYESAGAVSVDATRPIKSLVEQILSIVHSN